MSNPILEKFKEICRNNPRRIVLVSDSKEYTLEDIDNLSDNLSYQLMSEFSNQKIVPVITRDSQLNIISMFAIWKAGKIYLPINYDLPISNINKIISDLQLKNVWTDIEFKSDILFEPRPFILDFSTICKNVVCEEIAYILMTSGSTGNPKKVQVSFENLKWILETMEKSFPLRKDDKFLITTPPSFDVSLHEMLSFIYGYGEVVTFPNWDSIKRIKEIPIYIEKYSISHIALSPSACDQIINREKFQNKLSDNLKFLLIAGEKFSVNLANKLNKILRNTNIYNLYGPTETTIYATKYKLEKRHYEDNVPIGEPLSEVLIKINPKDENTKIGEILIGGKGVTKGYLNDIHLNKEKFILYENKLFYKTGDYGYVNEDGNIHFEGRIDNQVQVNGIRIELDEIDSRIKNTFSELFFKTLYINGKLVTFTTEEFNTKDFIEKLKNIMPPYMIPLHLVKINEIPLTPNRKIDNESLINIYEEYLINYSTTKGNNSFINDISKSIVRKYDKEISANDDIIKSLNLDSLETLSLILYLEEEFNLSLPDDLLNIASTCEEISEYIDKRKKESKGIFDDKNIEDSFHEVEDNYFATTFKLYSNNFCEEETFYTQKIYKIDEFEQVLYDTVQIEVEDKKVLSKHITDIVKLHSLLRSEIIFDREEIRFKKYKLDDFNYRIANIRYIDKELHQKIEKMILNKNSRGLMWFFIYEESSKKVHIYIDHNICDKSSLKIIKENIYNLVSGKMLISPKNNYSDFIEFNNKSEKEIKEYFEKLTDYGFMKLDNYKILNTDIAERIKYISIPLNANSVIENIIMANFLTIKIMLRSYNIQKLTGSTIIDIRKFNGLDITGLVGDVHTAIPVILTEDMEFNQFDRIFKDIYNAALNGHNVNNHLYKKYPQIPSYLKNYEEKLGDNLFFSINYLGPIRINEFDNVIGDLEEVYKQLEVFSSDKKYITVFHTSKELIIVPLNKFYVNKEYVKTLGGNVKFE